MNALLFIAIVSLPILIILPFWMVGRKSSQKGGLIQGILNPHHRRYTLSIPDDYSGEDAVPLVIVLHYGGHGIPYYGKYLLVDTVLPALKEIGAIFAAPDCPASDWTQPESEEFILELMEFVQREYKIDPRRILLTGYSMGGIGAWYLIKKFQEKFSAVLIMAAAPPENLQDVNWGTPMYVIHGREDELFPVTNTTRAIVQLEELGGIIKYRILERASHYDANRYLTAIKDSIPWLMQVWDEQ